MALSTRELYLVLRAKNEASRAFDSVAKDMRRAQDAANVMGAQASKAHQQMELATLRNAKAQEEFRQRQLLAEKAVASSNVQYEKARAGTLDYAKSMLDAQKASQQHQMALLQQKQAVDQNAVALLQNAKAQNDLRLAQLRSVEGAGPQMQQIRAVNVGLQDQINTMRNGIIMRQNEVNAIRQQINVTQDQINHAGVLRQNQQAVVMDAERRVRSYNDEIRASRDIVSQQKIEIANRELRMKQTQQEIRDIEQSNKAHEEHAKRLGDVGRAMTDVGTGLALASAGALTGMYQLTQAAVDYEKSTTMTRTQVRETGVTVEQLGKIGLQVARDFGVSFDDIQTAFFDIFSSTDATVGQATTLLREFSKAAIAGNTDIQTAGTTTIGVLNAWHRPLEDATKILDTQFKTVQLGRITYEQLNSSIGRSIPSAVRAGQSFEELSGMIAFMTRANMTGAQATTSAGRALDLFSNPKVVGRLKDMGINARDASGNFRPLSDVVSELQERFGKLDPAKRAEEIEALFKGSGNNIQARRFWDLVLASKEGADSFKAMVQQVSDSGGALDTAYGQMSDTMAVRNEKMKNQWKALQVELGTALFPALEQMINMLSGLATWFSNLDPHTQKFLAWAVVIGGVVGVAAGAILIFGGAIASIVAAGAGAALAIGGLIALIGGAFIAAWVLAYNKIGWFHDAVNAYMGGIRNAVGAVVDFVKNAWQQAGDSTTRLGGIVQQLRATWDQVTQAIGAVARWLWENAIKPAFENIRSFIVNALIPTIQTWYNSVVKPVFEAIGAVAKWLWENVLKPVFEAIQNAIRNQLGPVVTWLYNNIFKPYWDLIAMVVKAAWAIIEVIFGLIQANIKIVAGVLEWLWNTIWKPIWVAIGSHIVDTYNQKIKPILELLADFYRIKIAPALEGMKDGFQKAWNFIADVAKTPIRFVVVDILNNGLLKAYNKVADVFNVSPKNVQIPLPQGFATGGPVWGPGGPTDDLIPAMLSNGEHVLTAAEVRAMGGHRAVMEWRKKAMQHQALLAAGGPVGDMSRLGGVGRDVTMRKGPSGGPLDFLGDLVKDGFDALNPSKMFEKFLDMGGAGVGGFADAARGVGKKAVEGVIQWVKDKVAAIIPGGGDANLGGPSGNSIARILQWGRMFYPGASVSSGYRPGDPGYHGAGLAADLIGGGAAGMQQIAAGFYGMSGRLLELIHSGGPGYFVKNGARVGASFYASEIAGHYNHVHVAANNNALMDRGGMLRPGMTNVLNATGGAERVLSLAQTQSFDQLVRILDAQRRTPADDGLTPTGGFGRGGGGRPIVVNITTNEIDPRRHAAQLGRELSNQIG